MEEKLSPEEFAKQFETLKLDWQVRDFEALSIVLHFKNYDQVVDFFNRVAEIAKAKNHHPEICSSYETVLLTLTTHKAKGLTLKDFELAREIERIYEDAEK